MRPRWRSYRIAVITTLVWAAVTFMFNMIAGTNYGFLNRKPATPTLLDVLGRWPVYLLTGGILILIIWALMTWPWERKRRDKGKQLSITEYNDGDLAATLDELAAAPNRKFGSELLVP
jgi:uncharacterized membrane protein YwaF